MGLGLALGAAILGAARRAAASPDADAGHVVLVELFTSQGCSSCPPADQLLSAIGGQDGSRVVPLAFHVDFWNSQGWTDPFSSRQWTLRQVDYERQLGISQVYTPQAVVDGATQLVGSDAAALRAAIEAAAAKPGAKLALRLEPSSSRVEVGVDVALPEALRGRKLDLFVALFETGLSTPVGAARMAAGRSGTTTSCASSSAPDGSPRMIPPTRTIPRRCTSRRSGARPISALPHFCRTRGLWRFSVPQLGP